MQRFLSLDFFRGITIAAMIIVNDPGSWSHIYAPLKHAEWNGATPTDLVFPFFLFIVGVSISLSLSKRNTNNNIYLKILKRSFILFLLGILLSLFPKFDFNNLRVVGVLQRIAIVYLICALIYLNINFKSQIKIGIGLLIVYWITMMFIPFNGYPAGTLEPGNNFAAWVDGFIVPGRLYQKTWDPEGFYSTIPAVVSGISGMLCGNIILNKINSIKDKVITLFLWGSVILIIGYFWNYHFPLNKHLWTSSFVLYTSGLAMIIFAMSMWLIDGRNHQNNIRIGLVFGSNAITAYVLHGIIWRIFQFPVIGGIGFQNFWMNTGISFGLPEKMASFSWAIFYTFIIYVIINQLYRKKIFLKV